MDATRAHELLTTERERLSGLLDEHRTQMEPMESEQTAGPPDQHPGDFASDLFEREKEGAIGDSLAAELAEVDGALGRLEDGEYGRCQACGRDIPDERLEQVPAARYCVEHQAEYERLGGPGPA